MRNERTGGAGHTLYQGDEECVGGETLGPSGRGGGRQEKALEVVSQGSSGLGSAVLGPLASPDTCVQLSTPASVQMWPHPSSSAGYPRQLSGRAGRCARGPATGRGTPRRTRAVGTAGGMSVIRELGEPAVHALQELAFQEGRQ